MNCEQWLNCRLSYCTKCPYCKQHPCHLIQKYEAEQEEEEVDPCLCVEDHIEVNCPACF